MSDYDVLKGILNRKRETFINPCENTDKDMGERWKEDWETNKLLLDRCDDILFVFDENGQFRYISTSY